jgi:GPH family glycoside/pentoside/hexuronide:cation symporter
LKACFTNRSFIVFEVISFTVIYVQTSLMLGLNYYLAEFNLPALPLYGALALGIIVGVILFINVRDRWGIKKATMFMAGVFSLGCFLLLGLGRQLVPALIGFFSFGIGFAGGMYLIPLMNGDVVDMDEHRTGLRREGMYAGVNSFITKPAISLANSAFIWFLSMNNFDFAGLAGAQSEQAKTGILLGWVLIPAILLGISFLSLVFYPLAGEVWDKIKCDLAIGHAEKERRLLESQGIRYE